MSLCCHYISQLISQNPRESFVLREWTPINSTPKGSHSPSMTHFLSWKFIKQNSNRVRSLIDCNYFYINSFLFFTSILHQLSNLALFSNSAIAFSSTVLQFSSSKSSNEDVNCPDSVQSFFFHHRAFNS